MLLFEPDSPMTTPTAVGVALRYAPVMPKRSSKPRDPNVTKTSATVLDAPSDTSMPQPGDGKDPAAVLLGRRGGLKGGKARAAKLSAEERKEAARHAADARWSKG